MHPGCDLPNRAHQNVERSRPAGVDEEDGLDGLLHGGEKDAREAVAAAEIQHAGPADAPGGGGGWAEVSSVL